tara:strand:- start:1767 stop:2321 length:555 start_codon:yes stop_codon:yes gene_type:complete
MSSQPRKSIYNPITSERATFLLTSNETNGKKTVIEIEIGPKGKGPPLHFHKDFTEEFEMVKGQMNVKVEKKVFTLTEGESCRIEIGQQHTFWSESEEPVIFRGTLEPGNEEFENGIAIMFGLARDGYLSSKGFPKRISQALVVGELSDSHVKGILNYIFRLLSFFTNKNKLAKEKNELIDKYCN